MVLFQYAQLMNQFDSLALPDPLTSPDSLHVLDALHLLMVSGKGGVGKTTLACGLARRWARQFPDAQILLLSTDPAHSLGDVLQMSVTDHVRVVEDLPNLQVRSLDAEALLQVFKDQYGKVLELLVERGSFVQTEDLSPVWDLGWPGLDELMGILEIQRLLREQVADRIVVDMAPSGHTLNLFGLMDFLDEFLTALALFQEKHRVISQTFTGRYTEDEADHFLTSMKADLANGRQLLQDQQHTACLVVAIAEPMSLLETKRFLTSLKQLQIPVGGLFVNRILPLDLQDAQVSEAAETSAERGEQPYRPYTPTSPLRPRSPTSPSLLTLDRLAEQQTLLTDFLTLADQQPIFVIPQQEAEPVGFAALDCLIPQIVPAQRGLAALELPAMPLPERIPPGFEDFVLAGRRLLLVGGKGGVGKTTVAAAIAWAMATQHPDRKIRVISIDPAHSLGDAFGLELGHEARAIAPNLTAQEIDPEQVLDQFRADYLWELAAMMSGDGGDHEATLKLAYAPEAWRKIVSQALPGIDEMLSLVMVMELLESKTQDLIILDTAPTGHLLRFLEMPTALSDWLAWIFKLWIKYQDVVGRTEFMGRLRTLRQRVVQAQKKLKDPQHSEFIGVVLAQSAVLAEAERLTQSLEQMGVAQRYVVHNRFAIDQAIPDQTFPAQTLVRLPLLPRSIPPINRIEAAANLLFDVCHDRISLK